MEKWKAPTKEILGKWIYKCYLAAKDLTAWERRFIVDVKVIHQLGKDLSRNQIEILEGIYAEKTK